MRGDKSEEKSEQSKRLTSSKEDKGRKGACVAIHCGGLTKVGKREQTKIGKRGTTLEESRESE